MQKLRAHISRHPIPDATMLCESGGNLRAQNPNSSAGGRYQILASTWAVSLPKAKWVWLAGGDKGPRWSSRLLQDIVAGIIYRRDGPDAWSCS